MYSFFKNRATVALIFFVLGLSTSLLITNFNAHVKNSSLRKSADSSRDTVRSLFDDDFFSSPNDPFEEMRRLQSQIKTSFNEATELKQTNQYEQDGYLVYEFNFSQNSPPQQLQVDVKNGQINMTAKIESKTEQNGFHSSHVSSFQRTFPAPTDVDAEHFKLEQSENKVILKFPKKKDS